MIINNCRVKYAKPEKQTQQNLIALDSCVALHPLESETKKNTDPQNNSNSSDNDNSNDKDKN